MCRSWLAGVWLLINAANVACQLSTIATDDAVDVIGNKFLQRQATEDIKPKATSDEGHSGPKCSQNLELKWITEVSSSVYATPVITDLYSDGHKEIIVPAFVHHLEVLEGHDGAKLPDWNAFHTSTVHTSPLLYDVDFDGVLDIAVATYDGEILFFRDTGGQLPERITLERLPVRKNWFEGLAPDHVDHSHPDVGAADEKLFTQPGPTTLQEDNSASANATVNQLIDLGGLRRRLLADGTSLGADGAGAVAGAQAAGELGDEAVQSWHELFGAKGTRLPRDEPPPGGDGVDGGDGGNPAGQQQPPWYYHEYPDYMGHGMGHYDQPPGLAGRGGLDGDAFWDDEAWRGMPRHDLGELVEVDAHVLATPSVADIDGDGADELVAVVSYYFDRDYYDNPEHAGELPEGLDMSKYVACAAVAYDLRTRVLKWSQHLDLSTDSTAFRAYSYSAPTLADIDADGKMEVLLGTSVGFLYVLDSEGKPREGWPVQMGEIQGQVSVADVDGDGQLEVAAADSRGNVALFDAQGNERWERHVSSLVAQVIMFGDINGDGDLEAVFGSNSGRVHALNARTGADAEPFPFRTGARVMAPVLVTKLSDASPSQQLVVPSFDGHLYVIDGISGCADTVDIGETAYAMVLADDLDGNGRLDLLVATMNGNLMAFETPAPYHPLKAWTSQVHGRAGFVARYDTVGVYALASSRAPRDVRGTQLSVQFRIVDNRPAAGPPAPAAGQRAGDSKGPGAAAPAAEGLGPYTVAVTLQGVGLEEMAAGEQPVIGMTDTYATPGVYTLALPCPRTRSTATVHLEMTDRNGVAYVHEFALSFHMHFYRLLKWLVAVPFLAAALAVLALGGSGAASRDQLPSFSSRLD